MSAFPPQKDNVIINLKVLAQIKTGERLTMHNTWFQIQQNNMFQSLIRWYKGDDRWSNMGAIKGVVNDGINTLELYLESSNLNPSQKRYMESLYAELKTVTAGLQNFKETYRNDKALQANVDVLQDRIKSIVERVDDTFDYLAISD